VSLVARLAGFWGACSGRERAVIALAGVFILGAALYVFLWEPGLAARKSLSASLPRLRAQLEDMRWQRDQIGVLRKELRAAPRRGALVDLLRASVAQSPIASSIERIEALPGGRARLQGAAVPFAQWLAWIDLLRRELGVRIESCRLGALERPGMVQVDASLSFPGVEAAEGAK
jgi:general secretion pathway protein M